MDQFIYEDGSGNLYDKGGTSIAVIDMEVDNEQYPLNNITNFKQYMELKPSEKQAKGNEPVNSSEDDSIIKKEKTVKASYRSYKKRR